jgi:uncharacterized protein GlcG (DUF336 family)
MGCNKQICSIKKYFGSTLLKECAAVAKRYGKCYEFTTLTLLWSVKPFIFFNTHIKKVTCKQEDSSILKQNRSQNGNMSLLALKLFSGFKFYSIMSITLAKAKEIIAAGEKKAAEIGQPMNIAVVDAGGNLISHVRMDGAWLGSIDISIKKAFTARAFDITTKDLGENAQPGQQFYGIHASNDGKIMIFAGGIPLKKDGKVVGAIGVSGGSGVQDHSVAEAGAAAF